MNFKRIKILLVVTCAVNFAFSQIQLPMFDVELKVHQNLTPGDGNNTGELEFVESTNWYGGAHVQLGQYVAVGAFYSRSMRGVAQFRFNDSNVKDNAKFLQKGIDIRLSTGRARKWRQYLVVQYSGIEMLRVTESYRLADKSKSIGASLGIMRRLSSRLYFNVIELGVTALSNDIFWFGKPKDYFIINAKTGLSYNIGKKK